MAPATGGSDPADWGIVSTYRDVFGKERQVRPETRRAVLSAMGGHPGEPPPPSPVRIARRGERLPDRGRLVLEDGSDLGPVERLEPDLPYGYHRLETDGGPLTLIVGPGRCHLPADLHTWGWAAQLYAARSTRSWGIGDLSDLRRLAEWSRELGAGVLVVNPLHAADPVRPHEPSPYFPSSRRFRNPIYLRIEEVPGVEAVGADLAELARRGRELNAQRLLDREQVVKLKRAALERIWTARGGGPELDRFRAEQGAALQEWSAFAALAERHRTSWRDWPEEFRRPGPAVERFATAHEERVAFHAWVQWLIDRQLAAACEAVSLLQDMPVGVDPGGFDAWSWQDYLALDATVGAPPDRFNAGGQDWGLPPFNPHQLRAAGYRPLIETLRASMRHGGGLRIDHVLGLFRLWWIPAGSQSPAEGTYVRYPADELLEIVALESQRAGAMVVGEDLGTVEAGVRRELRRRRMLSYRVVWFERRPAARYPRMALAALTTHDLPTVAGAWSGSDVEDQERAGTRPNRRSVERTADRLARFAGVERDAPLDETITAAHRALGGTPSMIVTATLDDALAVAERPNMPGTIDEWPNWSIGLPMPLEEIEAHPSVQRTADALGRGRTAR